ncbi:MAG: 2OG-Fe(II) oxygenase [Rhodothermales bacterium]
MNVDAIVRPQEFQARGYCVKDGFLTPEECARLLAGIEAYRAAHDVPRVYRKVKGRSLHYFVIDGHEVERHLPEVRRLYQAVNEVATNTCGEPLAPMDNRRIGANVNLTPPGGAYRWHYDRNAVTAILYLNEVQGGETEICPNYRLLVKNKRYSALQCRLDRLLQWLPVRALFGGRVLVSPRRGSLVLMAGNRCLHSVRPVEGEDVRINLIFAYDAPGARFAVEEHLDSYLYTQAEQTSTDPNYL